MIRRTCQFCNDLGAKRPGLTIGGTGAPNGTQTFGRGKGEKCGAGFQPATRSGWKPAPQPGPPKLSPVPTCPSSSRRRGPHSAIKSPLAQNSETGYSTSSCPRPALSRTGRDGLVWRTIPMPSNAFAARPALAAPAAGASLWSSWRTCSVASCVLPNEAGNANGRRKTAEKWVIRSLSLYFPDRGGHAAAIHFSLIASARRHNLDPFAYIQDLLARIPTHPNRRIHELFPDHWKTLN